ncbi:RagB/SusD family nutrient uptake outer membrane protein [Cyclobacterium amurskyense]|uniref:Putative nutrient binding outer membrane protein n=1 Tax=Cyclobacterium amurskyense TaxID=320787 RepID=A0A0H4PEJ0_9BACT|nr:RagB/SusD family nutrient uptake outer membrane protein [Cyclobacterium amurskyense]AKP52684.1 Putative nutrient binding outer membrane protein [Cyclobacterium amurskyense]
MKIYKFIWAAVCLTPLLLLSCNDDFLERYPLDEVSNETFWNTENDLMVYNNSLYHLALNDDNVPILHGHFDGFNSHWGSYWFLDEFSDNLAPRHDRHAFFQQVRAGKQIVPNGGQWFGYKGWNFVRAINVGLENYDKADIPEDTRNKYVGEARLLRGWFYAEKVQKFGDVPWVDRELNIDSDELFAARTPREEAMDKVLEDLNFATENIPDDWGDGNEPGRLNRWAALAIKSRLCLYEGTWRKYHGGSNAEMWIREAAEAAKEVIDNSPYAIYNTGDSENDFNSFMRKIDISGNPEVMVWRRYQLGIYTNHVQSYFSYSGGATKSFVEDFLATDGKPISISTLYQGDDTIEDVFANRDPRLRQTILHPDDTEKYNYDRGDGRDYPRVVGMSGGFTTTTGYHIIKHYNADDMIGKAYNTAESPAIILRYAEVLLNYAEAKAELGEITQGDLDLSINQLRDRVNMPHLMMDPPMDPRYANDGVSPLIVEIRRERRVELFLEGFRYNDLKRWKQGKKLEIPDMGVQWSPENQARFEGATVQTSVDPESGKTYIDVYKGTDWANPVFDEAKHYLWPLPLDDLAQNPQLVQNPGYN